MERKSRRCDILAVERDKSPGGGWYSVDGCYAVDEGEIVDGGLKIASSADFRRLGYIGDVERDRSVMCGVKCWNSSV
jgi:hypothetical protein